SGADPLNLSGLITPGQRVNLQQSCRLLYRDGVPVAVSANGEIDLLEKIVPNEEWHIKNMLLRKHYPATYHSPPRRPI
ncbi:MAG: hypothetical protein MJA83_04675, partial [Gammaproteobacteria bacterium]|nr:hypothetical protein [Gammaproteobacteria bacterium]